MDALLHFSLIAEHGTFTSAARHAHLSQPALTASIQRLEAEMGARLFHRDRTGTSLTAAGKVLLPRAQAVLASLGDARRAVTEVLGLEKGEVRLGAGATACSYLLPPLLAQFRQRYPGVRFLLREATASNVLDALAKGELDMGVVVGESGEFWKNDELILVAAKEMAKTLAGRSAGVSQQVKLGASLKGNGTGRARHGKVATTKTRGASEVLDAPFVTLVSGTSTRELLERYFPAARVVMELGSIAAVKGNVRAGIGVALVSRSAVQTDLSLGRLVEVPHAATPIVRPLHIVHRGRDRLPPAAAALRRLLLEHRS